MRRKGKICTRRIAPCKINELYTTTPKRIVMKKHHTAAITLLLFIFSVQSVAQPTYNSNEEALPGIVSDHELTCAYQSRYIVTYSHSSNTNIRHYFTVQDMLASTPTITRFPLNIGYDPVGISILPIERYQVNDMRVNSNGICYFCGKKIEETLSVPPAIHEIGFIGMFSISDALNSTGVCTVFHLDVTTGLTRIEPSGNYSQVFAVGNSDYCPDPNNIIPTSYLVGLEYDTQNSTWFYDVVTPIHIIEKFTDVANCGGIIVSSKYLGDNYHIALRHTKNGPLRNYTYLNMLCSCNLYDMQTAVTSFGNIVACRKDNDPILMATRGGGEVTMAHSCYNIANGIAAYQLQTINLGDARVIQARYTPSSDYIYLTDLALFSRNLEPFFLAKYNTGSTNLISNTDWNATGTVFPYHEIQVTKCYNLESFFDASYSSEYIYVGGLDFSNQPNYFAEKYNYIGSSPSCFPATSFNDYHLLQNPMYSRIETDVELVYQRRPIVNTIQTAIVSTPVTPNSTCIH